VGCERSLADRRADHSHLCVSRGGIVTASRRADRILFVLGVKRAAEGGGFAAANFLVPRRLRGRSSGPIRVLRIALRATGLRPPVCHRSLMPPSGPDGEGQAEGQARNARGGPPRRGAYQEEKGNPRLFGT
jgi:hypothetical protein